jgi:flagellar biosynthesis protein FlhB
MAGGNDNKTEKPTSRRLQKAREKGQIARSKEIPSAAVLFGSLLILFYFGNTIVQTLELEMRNMLRVQIPPELTIIYLSSLLRGVALRVSFILVPVMLAIVALSIGSNVLQGGFLVSSEAIKFKFNQLNPVSGIKRLFSKNSLMQLAKSLVMVMVVSIISYQVVSKYIPLYPRLVLMNANQLLYWTATISYEIFIRVAVLLVILAIADYCFQKYQFTEQLKMSKQEVKDEHKDMDGDPMIKGRIRRMQREMARKRMMNDVPTADVIITNPTHYSVALSYKVNSMEAPKVVAKGVGFLALKIRELAQQHGIPLVENRPLAQTLYKTVNIGEYIPANLFKAVAEILAYVYKAKNMFVR